MAAAGFAGIVRRLLHGERSPASGRHPICIGHSHVACVASAARHGGTALDALNLWEMPGAIQQRDGRPALSDKLVHQLQHHDGSVFSMVGGSAFGILGLLVHPRRFDFVLPESPKLLLDETAEILPASLVRRLLEGLMADYLALMAEIRTLCRARLFHVEPPPPYADSQRMVPDIPWDMYPGMKREISPAVFRYKLWRMHSRILMDWCAEHDAGFVPCPPSALDQGGFLASAFYGDGAHANEAYGALVLAQMGGLA
jgi:hypothetical protein